MNTANSAAQSRGIEKDVQIEDSVGEI